MTSNQEVTSSDTEHVLNIRYKQWIILVRTLRVTVVETWMWFAMNEWRLRNGSLEFFGEVYVASASSVSDWLMRVACTHGSMAPHSNQTKLLYYITTVENIKSLNQSLFPGPCCSEPQAESFLQYELSSTVQTTGLCVEMVHSVVFYQSSLFVFEAESRSATAESGLNLFTCCSKTQKSLEKTSDQQCVECFSS